MANPSLQIGNGKWAIKEDNLLGYSTAGTRFVPQPITMTRATLGTRVNPSGLVEDVELLGSELVDCGDFSCATPSTYWNKTLGWSIADNKASNDGTGGILRQIGAVPLNTKFKVVFTVDDYVTGNIQIKFAPVAQTIVITGDGTYTIYTDGNNSVNGDLQIIATSSFQGSISNISVKEATIDNLPRVDYTDGTSSLLVEPQRTNLMLYSEDFSSNWTTSNLSVVEHSTTSPSGETSADKLVEDSSNSSHTIRYASPNTPVTNGVVYTMSFFAKKEERTSIRISNAAMSNTNGKFNLSNGQVISSGSSATNSMVDYGNGWYRCIMTFTSTTTIAQANIAILNANNDITYQGDGSSGLYMWGVQIEAGSYPTSYIPNFGTALGVTRVQETYTKTGISDKINSEEGVLFVEMAALSDDGTERYISLSDGSLNNRVYIQFTTTTNQIKMGVTKSGGTQASRPETVSDVTEFNKLAISYSQDLFKFYVNGSLVFTDSSGDTFTANTLNRLNFDVGTSGFSKFFGKVKQLQVYKTTDIDLAALTS